MGKFLNKFKIFEPIRDITKSFTIDQDSYKRYISNDGESNCGENFSIKVDIEFIKKGSYKLSGEFSGDFFIRCNRCSNYTKFQIPNFQHIYKYSEYGGDLFYDSKDENLTYYNSKEIDIFPLIYDEIIINIPSYYLCSEECKGLCPICGINLNENSCKHNNNSV